LAGFSLLAGAATAGDGSDIGRGDRSRQGPDIFDDCHFVETWRN